MRNLINCLKIPCLAFVALYGILTLLSSCDSESVVADFVTDTQMITQGETVTFINLSSGNPTLTKWEFPGGTPSISIEPSPRVRYDNPGIYEVRLTVKKAGSEDIEIKTGHITVGSKRTETVYDLTVNTGNRDNAGTNANVYVQLIGTNGQSIEFLLDDRDHDDFEKGSERTYQIIAPNDLGEIEQMHIRHDNSGNKPGWFLEKVRVKNTRTSMVWQFPCSRWLATSSDDGRISRIMYVNTRCD